MEGVEKGKAKAEKVTATMNMNGKKGRPPLYASRWEAWGGGGEDKTDENAAEKPPPKSEI